MDKEKINDERFIEYDIKFVRLNDLSDIFFYMF